MNKNELIFRQTNGWHFWRFLLTLTNAPWRTKLTGSNLTIGSNKAIASRKPVPAHAIPNAIAAP